MFELPSFIKDTTDFIKKLKNKTVNSKETYLVTLDVSSLYTNIPHDDGIKACEEFLHNGNINSNIVSKLLRLVLENNYFQFDDDFYLQKMGTAMGSPMAPAYASLFMGKLEKDFLKICEHKPTLWFRFLDDIFMIWDHSLEKLELFIEALNRFHPNMKFTYSASKKIVSFLDVAVSINDDLTLQTDIHIKETNNHQYLDYTSCHPKQCKDGIPYSQAKRYRRIISDDNSFKSSLQDLKHHFKQRDYPEKIIDCAFEKVSALSQEDALQSCNKAKTKVIPFTVEYNPSLPNIGAAINKYWVILNLSQKEEVRSVHETYKPILAFKRPNNIGNFITRAQFTNSLNSSRASSACGRTRCSHCKSIHVGEKFKSTVTGEQFNLQKNMNCASKDVIYLITCKQCKKQYVGQTMQPVSKRMNSHRFDIRNFSNPEFSTLVASHFNEDHHSANDFSFMPIDVVNNNIDRLCKETYYIHRLKTLHPNGMNNKVLFNIKD
jgi:hypothetical protein